MTLSDALEFLYSLRGSGVKLGLENMSALCRRTGNPQDAVPVIHIAGTNGKGSVAALLDSGLRRCGLRVGLFTSPHLVRFNERIRTDGVCITDEDLSEAVATHAPLISSLRDGGMEATFFEVTTLLAFYHFRQQEVDIAILETGLGGRLDSTNVVDPVCSVITSIGFDHKEMLGDTLGEIAAEKAGIIKPGRPVVIGSLAPEAEQVIREKARSCEALVIQAGEPARLGFDVESGCPGFRWGRRMWKVGLAGAVQAANGVISLEVMRLLQDKGWTLDLGKFADGLTEVSWPARFQFLSKSPVRVLDGAHNPDAWQSLRDTWMHVFGALPDILVIGCLQSKWKEDTISQIRNLIGPDSEIWSCPVAHGNSVPPELIGRTLNPERFRAFSGAAEVWEELSLLPPEKKVLLAGSLYLAGEWLSLHCGSVAQPELQG